MTLRKHAAEAKESTRLRRAVVQDYGRYSGFFIYRDQLNAMCISQILGPKKRVALDTSRKVGKVMWDLGYKNG